jgi:DNA polymerase-3 subunit delta'
MWKDLKSQPLVADLLQRALLSGRKHHGYLLIGEESEAEVVALAFAQALNCEKNNGDFCGQCTSCISIQKGSHPDIYNIKPESRSRRIVISQIRELEKSVYLKASVAQTKVAIIHCVDRLQPEAQDAFLKTLEEPPQKTLFMLLTEEPQQLKETILSRCLKLPLRPAQKKDLTENQKLVHDWLTSFTQSNKAESKVIHAYGFVGKILELLKKVREEKLEEAQQVLEDPTLDHIEKGQRERLEEQVEAQAQAEYLRERNVLLKTMVEWFHDEKQDTRAVEIVENLARQLGRNVNESLAWEVAMLELASEVPA